MKRILLTGVAAAAFASLAIAAPITPDEALARIEGGRMKAPGAAAPRLVHTSRTLSGAPAVYVFERGADAGYMVLSADDRAYPMLGYSDSGSFDPADMPPALAWWLEEYGRQIEYAAANGSDATTSAAMKAPAQRVAIEPMIKTEWDQGTPYNNQCPIQGTLRTYTGCVATSMAQVMNYWKYPERGTGSISYDASTLQKRLTMDFSAKPFDWENMLPAYYPGQYTAVQANAVSYLMLACGHAVKMDYGTDSSGALAMLIRNGLVKYFKYDGNTRYTLRMLYSASEWESLIYDNLLNVGPVLYGGDSLLGGGHSFVCDGYDGNGFFHFNWGWTGMSNGYYALNALNPESLGTGGGTGGGYNFTQDAVLGIQPPTGEPVVSQPVRLTAMGALSSTITDGKMDFSLTGQAQGMWVNYNPSKLNIRLGALISPLAKEGADDVIASISDVVPGVQAGYGVSKAAVDPLDLAALKLADGSYRVSIMTQNNTLDKTTGNYVPTADGWQPVQGIYGFPDYVTLTKVGDNYTVSVNDIPKLRLVSGTIETPLYYGCLSKIKITVENPTDVELTGGFAPTLYSGALQTFAFLGESIVVTVEPHGTVTREWVTSLNPMTNSGEVTTPTAYYLTFMDEDTYNVYSDDVFTSAIMRPNPGKPAVSLSTDVFIANAALSSTRLENIFTIGNAASIDVTATIKLSEGYFAYPVMACLCTMGEGGAADIITYAGTSVMLTKAGDTFDFAASIAYPEAKEGVDYYILMAYGAGSSLYPIYGTKTTIVRLDLSGIENVTTGGDALTIRHDRGSDTLVAASSAGIASLELYSTGGALLRTSAPDSDSATLSLTDLPRGLIIAHARDKAGNTRTLKIAH
ncbi:MAG: C10 family peptidase [Muribaculaceae bacterium]|nr:C10 family peptidase [Muribaculaceae bacterium]